MAASKAQLTAVSSLLEIDVTSIVDSAVYDDELVALVDKGILGIQKYTILLSDLPRPKPTTRRRKPTRKKDS